MLTISRRPSRPVLVVLGVPVLVLHLLGPASAGVHAADGEAGSMWSCGPLALDEAVATPPPAPAPTSAVASTIVGPLGVVADSPVLSVLCRWRI